MPAPRFHPLARLLCFALGALVIAGALQGVVVGALTTAARLNGQVPQQFVADWLQEHALLLIVVVYPPILGWLWFCRRALDRRSMTALGLHGTRSGRLFFQGAAGGACAIALLFGALWLSGGVRIIGSGPEAFEDSTAEIGAQLLIYALAFGAVGFMEEIAFRGYGLHNVAAWGGARIALWAQAIGFALIHLGNAGVASLNNAASDAVANSWADAWRAMPSIALIGWFFALTYFKTGSLWFAIGFHAAWNFFLGCVFSLPVSGVPTFRLLDVESSSNAWLSGGTFGAEGSLLLIPILLAMIWILRAQPDHPQAALDLSLLDPNATFAPETPLGLPDYESAWANVENEDNADGSLRRSRFQTSMRAEEESAAPWTYYPGQLPREPKPVEVTAAVEDNVPAPISAPPAVAAPETAPQIPLSPAPTPRPPTQSTLEPSAQAATPVSSPPREEKSTSDTATSATPAPKKPTPRW